MKFLRLITLFLIVVFLSQKLTAQNVFLRLGAGYGIPIAKSDFEVDQTMGEDHYSDKFLGGSYGQGLRVDITGIYNFAESWSAELSYEFRMSQEKLYKKQDLGDYFLQTNTQSISHYLNPIIVYHFERVGKKEDLRPYVRMGIVVPVSIKINAETSVFGYDESEGSYQVDQTEVFRHVFSPGFLACVGTDYKVSKQVTLFLEIEFRILGTRAQRSYLTKYKSERFVGDETFTRYLYNLTTSEKETNYHKEINENSNVLENPDFDRSKPYDKLTMYQPLSNIGINFGIIFKLDLEKFFNTDDKKKKSKN